MPRIRGICYWVCKLRRVIEFLIFLIEFFLDIVDYVEPNMLIVGSRGLGHLNG